ncbi:2OG-Fe(II) oxygenase [Rahnella aceris]|uniref:2OG-Fe(II) oxygenase n=1 Tax=Rahnella sp. (strain Y9602) TaxID=2703885 RepID=A0ABW6CH84_RAHSY
MQHFQALIKWLRERGLSENDSEVLILDCMKAGWSYELSKKAVENALNITLDSYSTPVINIGNRRSFQLDDRAIEVLMKVSHPRIFYFDNFLSHCECDMVIDISKGFLVRSAVMGYSENVLVEERSSNTAILKSRDYELLDIIDDRLSSLLSWPVERMEDTQVQFYKEGQEYQSHYDYYPHNLKRKRNRVGTVIIYLNNPEIGGETLFSDINLSITPRKGAALYFCYDRPFPSTMTKHAGCPVLSGEKWILTKWVHNINLS